MAQIGPLQPFALDKLRGSLCLCGRPTTAEHEFCFCSTDCARADALRALGTSDSHYRTVFQRACVPPGSGLRPQASAGQLRSGASAHQGWAARLRSERHVKPTEMSAQTYTNYQGTAPTLEQVTGAVLTRKTKNGGRPAQADRDRAWWTTANGPEVRTYIPRQGERGQNHYAPAPQVSLYPIPLPEDDRSRPTLKRAPPSAANLKDNIHKSTVQLFHSSRAKVPASEFERNFHPTSEKPQGGRVFGHPTNPKFTLPGNPQHHGPQPRPAVRPLPSIPSVRPAPPAVRPLPPIPSGPPVREPPARVDKGKGKAIRRSASFAGWDASPRNSQMGGDEAALMRAFAEVRAELRAVGDQDFDPRDYFKADSDEEYV